ncbi:MAG TPA: hypothetical protein VGJ20_20650 [Xanthobacteraceae bacterium]|jgi:hypothetical protein
MAKEPMHKMVDGVLMELTDAERAQVEADRANAPAPEQQPTQEPTDARSRSKRQ